MRKVLLATVALAGMALSMGSTQAATLLGTFAENDCAGIFGGQQGTTCNTGGTYTTINGQQVTLNDTPLIVKLNPNGSVDELGPFPSITGAEFAISGNLGAGTVNYTYTPVGADPALQYVVVKGGNFFNVYGNVSNTDTVFAPLNLTSPDPNDRYAVSHISFYDTAVPVPAPAGLMLMGLGLLGVGLARRKAA